MYTCQNLVDWFYMFGFYCSSPMDPSWDGKIDAEIYCTRIPWIVETQNRSIPEVARCDHLKTGGPPFGSWKTFSLTNGETRIHQPCIKKWWSMSWHSGLENLKSFSVRCDFGSWTKMLNPNCLGSPKFPARTYPQKWYSSEYFTGVYPMVMLGPPYYFAAVKQRDAFFQSIGRPPKSWWQPPIWVWMVGNFSVKGGGMEGCSLGGTKIFANKHKLSPTYTWSYI